MIEEIAQRQIGAIGREQCLAQGVSDNTISTKISNGQWQRLFWGVYYIFTGPIPRNAWLWGALLRGGPGSMLSHQTAAELHGLTDRRASQIHITVPSVRRVRGEHRLKPHTSIYADRQMNPVLVPPRMRIDETVVDLVNTSPTFGQALGWVTKACSDRITTTDRIQAAIDLRSRLRWRAEIENVVGDVAVGAMSALEICYINGVERAHGLPLGERQHLVVRGRRRQYDDVHYRGYRTTVELDGRVGHDGAARFRDMFRDNAGAVTGEVTLRYGWSDVWDRPCEVARQVTQVITPRGWTGTPHPCTSNSCVFRT